MDPTAAATPPATVPVTGKGLGSRLKAAYNAASQKAGRFLGHGDPTVLLIWQVLGGLTPEQAAAASERTALAAQRLGRPLSDAEVDALLEEVRGATPAPYDPAYGTGQQFQQAYQDVQAEYPGEVIGDADPRLLAAVHRRPELASLTAEQVGQVMQTGRQFAHAVGETVSPDWADVLLGAQ